VRSSFREIAALAVGSLVTLAAPAASAQCTTCSPLSLPSGSLVGPELGAARQASWAVYSQATTGWVGFPRQLADNKRFEAPESARYDLFLTTVQATALHRSGLGVDVVAPFGWLASRTGSDRRRDFSLGDAEVHGRGTTLLGRSFRLTGVAGAVFPTGSYTPRSGAEALGDSARALTIGRGVYWGLAEIEGRYAPARAVALTTGLQGRLPLGEANDGFRWGPELRTLGEVEVRPISVLGLAAGGELQMRAAGTIVDPFLNERVASTNVAATIVSVTPAVRARFDNGVVLSVTGRIPVFQDLEGLQFQQGPGVFAGFGYVFPVGSSAPALPAYETATTTGAALVVREYGADWCEGCKKLEPLLDASRARRKDVRFERVDVTEWSQDELARRVPGAKALPIVEVLRGDGSLVARLEGEEALSFDSHLTEKVR
jgi:thiol-disulfide isomerase/thioredoxin